MAPTYPFVHDVDAVTFEAAITREGNRLYGDASALGIFGWPWPDFIRVIGTVSVPLFSFAKPAKIISRRCVSYTAGSLTLHVFND